MQRITIKESHYENVPRYSLDELEELSKREADEAWERAERAEQRAERAEQMMMLKSSFYKTMKCNCFVINLMINDY